MITSPDKLKHCDAQVEKARGRCSNRVMSATGSRNGVAVTVLGMVVTLTVNLDIDQGLVNGARGRIIRYEVRGDEWDSSKGIINITSPWPVIEWFHSCEPTCIHEVLLPEEIAQVNGSQSLLRLTCYIDLLY